ncbi:MAG: PIN domain-containing protein [Acidobacteria bacterium]|nr:PIN domain-containing protein [Acidobacteriota bacterium]
MGTLIDSSVLIAAQRGQIDPAPLSAEDEDEPIAVAAISASELLHGVHRLKGAVARLRAERFVEHILSSIPVVAFDLDIARVHARIDAELSAGGAAVGDADLMIAATAVWLDYRVATRDRRSFPRIKGLRLVRW